MIWILGEFSLNASGLSYQSSTQDYTRYRNVNPIGVELTLTPRDRIKVRYNITFSNGTKVLKNGLDLLYMKGLAQFMERMLQQMVKFYVKVVTFMLSAFWHGFYPCYYIAFAYFQFCTMVERLVYKNRELLLGKPGTIQYWLKWAPIA